jgi:2-amino-4-hydroxy-6-hydroxymethyldihydropteridine diphosphokinase
VVSAYTDLPLMELDRRLKFIEADNGRYAPDRKGLPLDIDVLLYGDLAGNFDGLVLPRAEILKNAFVLWPLSLIAPDRVHPGVGKSFATLWAEAQIDQVLAPVAFEWRGQQLTPSNL